MSVSVIIPAHNEQAYLNRTIDNIFTTAKGEIEVIVVLNGYDQEVELEGSPSVAVVRWGTNKGERTAMNYAACLASKTHLFRIDAHCDFTPDGWDVMLEEVTDDKTITVAVLTALDKQWNRLKGHWYGFARLLPSMEAKWEKPNIDKGTYETIEPNMTFTGCGFMLTKKFYNEIGGADESLPKMGAIGEEFSIRAWLNSGKVQTRTDVIVGHIFGTGAYDTQGVIDARRTLETQYGYRWQEIADRFPNIIKLKTAEQLRTVTVNREDVKTIRQEGMVVGQIVKYYRYLWIDDGSGLTEEQVCEKYKSKAVFVGQKVFIVDDNGKMIEQEKASVAAVKKDNMFWVCGNCGTRLSNDDEDPAYGHSEKCDACGIYNT